MVRGGDAAEGGGEGTGEADNSLILRWASRRPRLAPSTVRCGCSPRMASARPARRAASRQSARRAELARVGAEVSPLPGAVLIFWRGREWGWQRQLILAGEDAASFHVLGGNQSDAVTIARIARTRLLGARWPATAPSLAAGAIGERRRGRRSALQQRGVSRTRPKRASPNAVKQQKGKPPCSPQSTRR